MCCPSSRQRRALTTCDGRGAARDLFTLPHHHHHHHMNETIRPDAGAIEGMVYAIPASILFFWLPLAILLL